MSATELEEIAGVPLQTALLHVAGVEASRLVSSEGGITCLVTAAGDRWALAGRMREALSAVPEMLPEYCELPTMTVLGAELSSSLLVVSAADDPIAASGLAREARRVLLSNPAIGDVELMGESVAFTEVVLAPERLAAYGVQPADVIAAIERSAVSLPGGVVATATGGGLVRAVDPGPTSLETLAAVVIAQRGDLSVALRQLATLRTTTRSTDTLRVDGVPSVGLRPRFRAGKVQEGMAALRDAAQSLGPQARLLDSSERALLEVELPAGESDEGSRVAAALERRLRERARFEAVVTHMAANDVRITLVAPHGADLGELGELVSEELGAQGYVAARVHVPGRRVVVGLFGPDREVLRAAAETLIDALSGRDEVRSATSMAGPSRSELRITIDREAAARFGVTATDVARAARLGDGLLVRGDGASDLVVRVAGASAPLDLAHLPVESRGGEQVLLADVAKIVVSEGLGELTMRDGLPVVEVAVDLRAPIRGCLPFLDEELARLPGDVRGRVTRAPLGFDGWSRR